MSDPGEPTPDPKPSLRSTMRDLVEGSGARQGHPETEELLAYAEGRLEGERAERLKDHLAICPDCAKLFLDLKAFSKDVDAQDARSEPSARAEAAWWELQSRIQGEEEREEVAAEPVAEVQPIRRGPRPASRTSWQRFAMPLAAGILFVAVGLGIWSHQRRPVAVELQANQEVSDRTEFLIPEPFEVPAPGTERGVEVPKEEETPLPANEDHSLGLPLPPNAFGYTGYRGEVVRADGRTVSTLPKLELKSGMEGDSDEGLTLELHRDELPPGHYKIWIYGTKAGTSRRLASYSFRITE